MVVSKLGGSVFKVKNTDAMMDYAIKISREVISEENVEDILQELIVLKTIEAGGFEN